MTNLLVDDSSTGITCKKFYNRLYYCYYFKERNTYTKSVRLLFKIILEEFKISNKNLLEIFSDKFSNRKYTGRNSILGKDKKEFKAFCLKCIINLNGLFNRINITDIMAHYCYKWKVKGFIHGIINSKYNLSLSFENRELSEKELDFFCINNFLYNKANNTNNDLILMNVPLNIYYYIKFDIKDYTIQRGFLTFSKGNKIKKRGEHCINCVHDCKPNFYNGLERLLLNI